MSPALIEVRASTLLATLFRGCVTSNGTTPTLADVPISYFADIADAGFQYVYLLGVWQTGQAGLEHSCRKIGLMMEKQRPPSKELPPHENDIRSVAVSSPFAITEFEVHSALGGDSALRVFKAKANAMNLRVLVDFVPNHVAQDHWWTRERPWLCVQGTAEQAAAYPNRYFRVKLRENQPLSAPRAAAPTSGVSTSAASGASADSQRTVTSSTGTSQAGAVPPVLAAADGGDPKRVAAESVAAAAAATTGGSDSWGSSIQNESVWLAYGRDPHSAAWEDTAQLNYRHPELRQAMKRVLTL